MHTAGSGAATAYRAAGLTFDVRPMPVGASGNPATAGSLALLAVAASGDPTRRRAAMDLARYLTGAQVGRDAPGYYPAPGARRSVVVGDPLDKFSPLVASCYVPPALPEWPRVRTILHTTIQDAVFGKVSPEDALRAAEQEVNDLLSRSRG